ncbi:hypothetical protein CR513_45074, partial [Mucuna pruriens]
MNGVTERRNRTLKDMVRSVISHSSLLESLWEEALKTAIYILNRLTKPLMNFGLAKSQISNICTFEIVQLKHNLIGHMKEN